MRPPPVHFPPVHWAGPGVTQKLGFGAMLTFGWSVHAAASSPAAMTLGQTISLLCSRIMCVLPSSLFDDSRRLLTTARRPQSRCHQFGKENPLRCRDLQKMLQPRGDARAAISRAQLWRAHELHRYNRG